MFYGSATKNEKKFVSQIYIYIYIYIYITYIYIYIKHIHIYNIYIYIYISNRIIGCILLCNKCKCSVDLY